jgi:LPPG:FO 2-phospho-L-lactate transferase
VTSIGPILAVPGIRDALGRAKATIAAVSPIVGGEAVSGPASVLMKMMRWESGIAGVAKAYEDFLDVLIADHADEGVASAVSGPKLCVVCTNTIMESMDDKRELARFTLKACSAKQGAGT